ncbi:MAG: hypothetical protein KA793_00885 [Bacteroidales bacterium]|nr:hypothetical protein [Bacteroidales bacterium]
MVRFALTILFLASFCLGLQAQRFSMGKHAGVTFWGETRFQDEYIFPKYSYNVFGTVTDKGSKSHRPIFGVQFGLYFQLEYARFFMGTELSPSMRASNLTLTFLGSEQTLTVYETALETPVFLGVKITGGTNFVSLYAGACYVFANTNIEDGAVWNDAGWGYRYSDIHELYGIAYNNLAYWRIIGGIGWNINDMMISVRFEKRIDSDANRLDVSSYSISFHYNETLSFQKMNKHSYIYY